MNKNYEDIDYKNNYFDYPDLTRIIGEPTTATLITLHNEVKANAVTVPCPLGGGQHGHLGLVCTPEAYATLVPENEPYIRPQNPGILTIEGNETQHQIAQRKAEHEAAVRLFRQVLGVERAIIQQIVSAIEPKYLKALRNPVTNKITKSISEIFEYLFDTYGDVSPQELKMLTSQVEALNFPPNEPVDTIFTEIDDLETIAEIAKAPITEQQKINMGYLLLLQNTQVYTNALNKWNQLDRQQHTWENFKTHFRNAQKSLCRTGALTLQDSINHTDLLNLVQQGVHMALAEKESPTDTLTTTETTPKGEVNSVTSDLTLQTLQNQMDLMTQMMETIIMMQNLQTVQTKKKKHNPNQNKYCWRHTACTVTPEQIADHPLKVTRQRQLYKIE